MSTNRPRRISRTAAEHLLGDGPARPHAGQDRLTRLLAAAAAPARDSELAGEDKAMAAFRAEHLVPVTQSGRGQMITSPLAKLLTIKVFAGALVVFTAGGVAVAAGTGALQSSPGHTSVRAHASSTGSAATPSGALVPGQHPGPTQGKLPGVPVSSLPPLPTAASVSKKLAGLCRTLAVKVDETQSNVNEKLGEILSTTGLEQALANPALQQVVSNPAFSSLVAAAGNKANVAGYCGLLLRLPTPVPDSSGLPVPTTLPTLPVPLPTTLPTALPLPSDLSSLPGLSGN